MTYAPPDKAAFIAIFPAFAAVPDEAYVFWSAQAVLVTAPQEGCLDQRMDLATMLLTAHYLTLSGLGVGAEAEMAAQGMGSFKSIKSGALSLDRGENASMAGAEYANTSYGKRFWPMIAVCFAGPCVTGSGSIMGCGGYRSGPFGWQ